MAEELGLVITADGLEYAFCCPAEQAPWGGCSAYEHVYFLAANSRECKFVIGSFEVTSVRWMAIDELRTEWEKEDESYVPRVEQYKEAFFQHLHEMCSS